MASKRLPYTLFQRTTLIGCLWLVWLALQNGIPPTAVQAAAWPSAPPQAPGLSGLASSTPHPVLPTRLPAQQSQHVQRMDQQKDGMIDQEDVNTLARRWLQTGAPGWISEDVNRDGTVDTDDVVLIGLCFGLTAACDRPASPTATPTGPFPTAAPTASPTNLLPTAGPTGLLPTAAPTGSPTPTQVRPKATGKPASFSLTPSTGMVTLPAAPSRPISSAAAPARGTATPTARPLSTAGMPPGQAFTPTVPPAPTKTLPPAAVFAFSAPTRPVSVGQVFEVEIKIEAGQATRGAALAIRFDPAVLRCESAREGGYYSEWAAANGAQTLVMPAGACDNRQGVFSDIGIALLGGTGGPSGPGTVITLVFTALSEGSSQLALENLRLYAADGRRTEFAAEMGQVEIVPAAPLSAPSSPAPEPLPIPSLVPDAAMVPTASKVNP